MISKFKEELWPQFWATWPEIENSGTEICWRTLPSIRLVSGWPSYKAGDWKPYVTGRMNGRMDGYHGPFYKIISEKWRDDDCTVISIQGTCDGGLQSYPSLETGTSSNSSSGNWAWGGILLPSGEMSSSFTTGSRWLFGDASMVLLARFNIEEMGG